MTVALRCLPFKYYNAGQYCSFRRCGEIDKWLVKHKTLATPAFRRARFRSKLFYSLEKREGEETILTRQNLKNDFL